VAEKKYFEDEKAWMDTWDAMNNSVESLRATQIAAQTAYSGAKRAFSTSASEAEVTRLSNLLDELYEPVGDERKKMTDWLNEEGPLAELRPAPGAAKATRRVLLQEYNVVQPSLTAGDDAWKESYAGVAAPEIRLGRLQTLYEEKQRLDVEWAALESVQRTALEAAKAKIAEQALTLGPLEEEAKRLFAEFRVAEDARDKHKNNVPTAPAGTTPNNRILAFTSVSSRSVNQVGTLFANLAMRRKSIAGGSSDEDSSDGEFGANLGRMSGIFFRPEALRHGVATNHAGAHFGDGTAVDVSHDSIKFAQYMHLSVMGLAYDFVNYYHPELSGSVPAVVVAAATGDRYDKTYNALDLLEAMVARTLKHYNDKYAAKATTANL